MIYEGFVKGIELKVLIGLHAWERQQPQTVIMDIHYKVFSDQVGQTDNIDDTLNYQTLVEHLKETAEKSKFLLMERLANHLLAEVDQHFKLQWIRIQLAKTTVIECAQACGVAVERHYE